MYGLNVNKLSMDSSWSWNLVKSGPVFGYTMENFIWEFFYILHGNFALD